MSYNFKIQSNDLTVILYNATKSVNTGVINISDFSISEEDLRKKSCKFNTFRKIDITEARWFVFSFYNKKCVFGGVILSTDYNESDGSYTVQCQDFNRWLTTKTWLVNEEDNQSIYQLITTLCNNFTVKYNGFYNGMESYYLAKKNEYELYPTKMKESTEAIGSTVSTEEDTEGLNQKPGVFYEDKTLEEILRSLWSASNCAVDMYMDNVNTLRFDPITLESWQNPKSLYFTTKNLSDYSYKNDATNIVTEVTIKDTDIYSNHTITKPNMFFPKEVMGFDLVAYFGLLNVFVQNTNSTSTSTSTSTTNTSTDSDTSDSDSTDTTSTEETEEEKAEALAKLKVENAESNEKLARAKFSEGLRDLMSFTITYNGFVSELHTNMFIWFELPEKHVLSNYRSMVAGIDKTTTRGGSYVLNRYYVEKVETTFDNSSIQTKITLNPFASDLSSYYKTYIDAISKYEQANCTSDSSSSTSTDTSATTSETITVTGMPSTGQASKYYSYKKYTKTWKNYCPLCKKSGHLSDNPKGVYEHEITCGACDADYDVVTGGDKSGSYRAYLTDSNGKQNTKSSVDTSIGGGTSSDGTSTSSGATSSTGASSSTCVNSSSGSTDMSQAGTVSATVKAKANQVTNLTGIEAVKVMASWNGSNIQWENEKGFYQTPERTLSRMTANCCCKADLLLQMSAVKGVIGMYVHVKGGKGGHVFCRFNGTYVDPTKRSNQWGNYCKGFGTIPGTQTTYPKKPF